MKLYEISEAIFCLLGETEEEMTDEQAAALAALEMAFEQKADSILKYRQSLVAEAAASKAEEDRLAARRRALTKKADWLADYLLSEMSGLGIKKIAASVHKAAICIGPPKVSIEDVGTLPDEFVRIVREPDRNALKEAAKAGRALPPGVTIAQEPYLKIS